MRLSGFGNWPCIDAPLYYFRGVEELAQLLKRHPNLIARGNGRAYGDAALNSHATISTLRHDRLIAFDQITGELTCESGVMLRDIIEVFLPRGWFPRVTPGTKMVTVGGMIAADVHGKNHHSVGSFCNHVTNLRVMGNDGVPFSCSRDESPDLFAATCGGMGLTGVIVDATFRLGRLETTWMRRETRRARNLAEVMEEFEQSRDWHYSLAWIDCLSTGEAQGRSLLYLGEHAAVDELPLGVRATPLTVPARRPLRLPFFFPSATVNRWTARAFNEAYYRLQRPATTIVDYENFFYPLDSVRDWNRIYGRAGFTQYQCVLPRASSKDGLSQLLSRIAGSGCGAWLATLKLFGRQEGLMSFPMEGYSLAVDLSVNPSTLSLLANLDAIVADRGGRLYLAKDARSSPDLLRKGYPGLDRFQSIRAEYGAEASFSSLLSRRLDL
jgi:decaprenylphospho-beta-D-ribofuranose 2-oxidase